MIVLGIETSCDDTGLALYCKDRGLLGHVIHSQLANLRQYGGVIPEIAARDHLKRLKPLLEELLIQTDTNLNQIGAIAYTKGPGLVGALLTGAAFAKTLGYALQIPTIGINHLEGHVVSCLLQADQQISFPFICLLVSGGHTSLIYAYSFGNYRILGETLDDAAGEALDKVAKLLGLDPPNGATLAALAATHTTISSFTFTRPMARQDNYNFSFSGLKTAASLQIKSVTTQQNRADLACGFQAAVMDSLIIKCKKAVLNYTSNLVVVGGVSANSYLRQQLAILAKACSIKVYYPKLEFCTDNGAMIAIAGWLRLASGNQDNDLSIQVQPRWPIDL